MSIAEMDEWQREYLALIDRWTADPKAWLLEANPVWGSSETVNRIALFDTKEQAEAYLEASKIPEALTHEERTTKDGYSRSFRSDSLLWDYNPTAWDRPMVHPAIAWHKYDGDICTPPVTQNPLPPLPKTTEEIKAMLWSIGLRAPTDHPRYGKDFDAGYGGPRSNMDGVVPIRDPGVGG